jgi:hypothetical protein
LLLLLLLLLGRGSGGVAYRLGLQPHSPSLSNQGCVLNDITREEREQLLLKQAGYRKKRIRRRFFHYLVPSSYIFDKILKAGRLKCDLFWSSYKQV